MKHPKARSPNLKWTTYGQLVATVTKDRRKLAILVQPFGGAWQAMALESKGLTPEEILGNHAHAILGNYDTPSEAMIAADSFARAWIKGRKSARAENCDCAEIPKATKNRSRRRAASTGAPKHRRWAAVR